MQKEKAEKKKRRRRVRFRRSDALYTMEDWEAYERGIRLFNREKFFEAHEAWEEIWHRAHEVDRRFLQGLIQAAAFLLKVEQGNLTGAPASQFPEVAEQDQDGPQIAAGSD